MSSNRVVVYKSPGEVEVAPIDYPRLEVPQEVADHFNISRKAPHAAILKVVTTNICGSDQHMVRGRTTAPVGQTLGHEITGEVVEAARMSSSSKRAISAPCPSTSPAAAAACATEERPASASTSIPPAPEPPTATWTWAGESAARPST